MFGEGPLFGNDVLRKDGQGRIYLPKYTKKEKDDELILKQDEDVMNYEIYSVAEFNKIMEILNKKAIISKNKSERTYYKKRIYEMSKSILKRLKVDAGGRVNIGNEFIKTEKILCIGAYNHLILEPINIENKNIHNL